MLQCKRSSIYSNLLYTGEGMLLILQAFKLLLMLLLLASRQREAQGDSGRHSCHRMLPTDHRHCQLAIKILSTIGIEKIYITVN